MSNQGNELLFRVINPKKKILKGNTYTVIPNYNTPASKWEVLEFMTKEHPEWATRFLYSQLFDNSRIDSLYSHESQAIFGMQLMLKIITSPTFILDLQQFLARWIVMHRDDKCECKIIRANYVPRKDPFLTLCPDCQGTGLCWSSNMVALAGELLKVEK